MMSLRRGPAVVIVLGVALGTGVALADREPAPKPSARVAIDAPRTTLPQAMHKPRTVPGTARIEARAQDPAGAAPWIARVVETRTGQRRDVPSTCAHVGRLVDGALVWIAPDGQARAVSDPWLDLPSSPCITARTRRAHRPSVAVFTTITDPARGAARPQATVIAGVAGRGTRSVRLMGLPGGVRKLRASERGAFLAAVKGAQPPNGIRIEITWRDGFTRSVPFGRPFVPPRPPDVRRHQGHPVGPQRIAVRAPDPAGGVGWALPLRRSSRGGWCEGQPSRGVGDQVGFVDARLGTFLPDRSSGYFCGDDRHPLTRRRPLRLGTGVSSITSPGGGTERSQVARRSLPGHTVLSGVAHPSVRFVVITTPRDVRTLVPSRLGRGLLAVYDGTFPTGRITATAHLDDGRVVSQHVETGM